jgi:hypothetical protein
MAETMPAHTHASKVMRITSLDLQFFIYTKARRCPSNPASGKVNHTQGTATDRAPSSCTTSLITRSQAPVQQVDVQKRNVFELHRDVFAGAFEVHDVAGVVGVLSGALVHRIMAQYSNALLLLMLKVLTVLKAKACKRVMTFIGWFNTDQGLGHQVLSNGGRPL